MAGKYEFLSFEGEKVIDLVKVKMANSNPNGDSKKPSKLSILLEQVLDSAIVAGIVFAASMSSDVTIKAALLTFAIKFLTKLKELRKISD